jgi:hypothetical protein
MVLPLGCHPLEKYRPSATGEPNSRGPGDSRLGDWSASTRSTGAGRHKPHYVKDAEEFA